jgi:hypothetical protein
LRGPDALNARQVASCTDLRRYVYCHTHVLPAHGTSNLADVFCCCCRCCCRRCCCCSRRQQQQQRVVVVSTKARWARGGATPGSRHGPGGRGVPGGLLTALWGLAARGSQGLAWPFCVSPCTLSPGAMRIHLLACALPTRGQGRSPLPKHMAK